MPTPLRGAFIGEGTLLVRCAETFLAAGHEICAVVSAEPLVGRWAEAHQIPHRSPGGDLLAVLRRRPFDYLFSVANLRVLPKEVLALPRKLPVNFHDSLLPRYAGLYATSWAILHREKVHGITWHEMTDRLDEGRILKQRAVPISDDETAFSLNAKCYEAGVQAFAELVGELEQGALTQPAPQEPQARTYFPRYLRPPAAALVQWEHAADDLNALSRALTFGPYPNPLGLPKIDLGDAVFLAPQIAVTEVRSGAPPGTITGLDAQAVRVATGTKDVELRELRTIDGRRLEIAELTARYGLRVGSPLSPRRGRGEEFSGGAAPTKITPPSPWRAGARAAGGGGWGYEGGL
ncbi:MAG TPA: formyltransferase family protein [Chloroflexota bacterium]|nr:formyltransferase family protein [Chloroflexota bacterium]